MPGWQRGCAGVQGYGFARSDLFGGRAAHGTGRGAGGQVEAAVGGVQTVQCVLRVNCGCLPTLKPSSYGAVQRINRRCRQTVRHCCGGVQLVCDKGSLLPDLYRAVSTASDLVGRTVSHVANGGFICRY